MKDFITFSIPGKSQAWMADIAYRYLPLEKLAGVLTLPQIETGHKMYFQMAQSSSHNFLIFDDGAFSCDQFYGYLRGFSAEEEEREPFATTKNLYFIFGHFPRSKYNSISKESEDFKKININAKIITSNFINSWENDSHIGKHASKLSNSAKMTVSTEWKRPDFKSLSMFIAEGWQFSLSKSNLGELSVNIRSVEVMDGEGPIANVSTPYLSKIQRNL